MPAAKIPQIGDLFLGRLENAGKISSRLRRWQRQIWFL
jgi:hypothetical protein